MSQANSDPSPFGDQSQQQQQAPRYRKPRADLYTMLLLIAWIALLLGILVLYLEMKEYDFKFKGAPAMLTAPAAVRTSLWCSAGSDSEDGRCEGVPSRNDWC